MALSLKSNRTVTETVLDTSDVNLSESGEVMFTFSTALGHRSGKQTFPANELKDLVSALKSKREAGEFVEVEQTEPQTAADYMRESLIVKDGFVHFRTVKGNKGVRSTKIPLDQIDEVLEVLEGRSSDVSALLTSRNL